MLDRKKPVVIVGAGVIGLSIAWELANRGRTVVVLDKNKFGRKASWAGAGILAPANVETASHPIDKLMGFGNQLHQHWAQRLRFETGIDNGYRNCGGVYIARTPGEKAALIGQTLNWQEYEIDFEPLRLSDDATQLSAIRLDSSAVAFRVPGESQICNPDHLIALVQACQIAGVRIIENCGDVLIERDTFRISRIATQDETFAFDYVCFCAGAWTNGIIENFGIEMPMIPVRGQMLLYKLDSKLFSSIINEGSRYVVPRDNGYVLVGSTIEEVGFNESTTTEKIEALSEFAAELVPALNPKKRIKQWAGLRPASHDGFPYMGRLAGLGNAFVATGHFKIGLQVSPATAVIMADMIENKTTIMDVAPFDPSRLDFSGDLDIPTSKIMKV